MATERLTPPAMEAMLAACFKAAGADCDGNEDWRIAPSALRAVQDLRRDYDDACDEVATLTERISDLEARLAQEEETYAEMSERSHT